MRVPKSCRFVFASSGAVYEPEEEPHTEFGSPLAPSDVYGYSKYHGEQYVRYFASAKGFPAVIVRLFNVVGPGETNPHVLPEIVAQTEVGSHRAFAGKSNAEERLHSCQRCRPGIRNCRDQRCFR